MIEKGQRVKCIKSNCVSFGQEGVFIGHLANAWRVKFDNGSEGLYLPDELRKI